MIIKRSYPIISNYSFYRTTNRYIWNVYIFKILKERKIRSFTLGDKRKNRRSTAFIVFAADCLYINIIHGSWIQTIDGYFRLSVNGKCFTVSIVLNKT